jgi:hypothetical protein
VETVVLYAQLALTLLATSAAIFAAFWARSAAHDGAVARKLVEALAEAFRKGHPYSDPSAAAVVTPAPTSGEREAPDLEPVHARIAAGAARERRLPPGALPAPALDTEGDRAGLNPEPPALETDRAPPRALSPAVARALGVPPGTVGLTLEESDAAQAQEPEIPFRRSMLTEHPSEPPPSGAVPVPAPPSDDPAERARWGATLQRLSRPDEVTAPGTVRAVPSGGTPLENLARLTPDELARVDALAAERGISREAMIRLALVAGSVNAIANDSRAAGPTTPPSGPANDTPPPPSGRRRS